ncbi:MAG: GNAT family N-acetyltransferase [Pseudomonadota bacterium]
MQLLCTNALSHAVSAEDWNALAGDESPFIRYEFLNALEQHNCLEPFGWQPSHLLIQDDDKKLIGAMPLYIKGNSYGEFVFDWSWASAYERNGLDYYPKMVCSIPYTPAAGPRLLAAEDAEPDKIRELLCQGAQTLAQQHKLSSVHFLFTNEQDRKALEGQGLMLRQGYQFHWENDGYETFDDYLGAMTSKRRKQIKRERRDAHNSGVIIEVLDGHNAESKHWKRFHDFYVNTYNRKWGHPALNQRFFEAIGETMPDNVVLIMAREGDEYVAGAFSLRGRDQLFGRHYGCTEYHRHLHFEMCYYQEIEYCINNGLQRFEAGAQGEHKLSRGLLPNSTWSAHWIADPRFAEAIQHFLTQERREIEMYIEELDEHSPFKAKS